MMGAATAALTEMIRESSSRRASLVATAANAERRRAWPAHGRALRPVPAAADRARLRGFSGSPRHRGVGPGFHTGDGDQARAADPAVHRPRDPGGGPGEFIAAGVAAFAAYALNGLFASVVPGFTTAMLHHADYAIAGGITCLFFAAGAIAALSLARLNSRPVLLAGLGLLPARAGAGPGRDVDGIAGAVRDRRRRGRERLRSSHHRQPVRRQPAGPRRTRAKVISTYFVFAYSGLSIPVLGVGIASGYVGNFRAVLGCSVVLAVPCALSAARISGGRRAARPPRGARGA